MNILLTRLTYPDTFSVTLAKSAHANLHRLIECKFVKIRSLFSGIIWLTNDDIQDKSFAKLVPYCQAAFCCSEENLLFTEIVNIRAQCLESLVVVEWKQFPSVSPSNSTSSQSHLSSTISLRGIRLDRQPINFGRQFNSFRILD